VLYLLRGWIWLGGALWRIHDKWVSSGGVSS
jgi:hypothetical protein